MHVGFDTHKKRTVGVVVHEDGTREGPFSFPTTTVDLEHYAKNMMKGTVFVEASTTGKAVVRTLRRLGTHAVLCHPDAMFNALRKNADDEHDAEHWAMLGKLGAVKESYLPTEYEDHVRSLTRRRHDVVLRLNQLHCQAHAALARNLVQPPVGKLENASCRRRWARLQLAPGDQVVLAGLLREMDFLYHEREEVTLAVHQTTKDDAVIRLLLEIPGVDVVTAATIRAEFGDMNRFPSPKKATSYAGLVPRNWQSGDSVGRGRMTKMGNPTLRHALVQSAYQTVRFPGDLRRFYTRLRGRVGTQKAIVGVARKLVHIAWALIVRGERYWHTVTDLTDAKTWRHETVAALLAAGHRDHALRLLATHDLKRTKASWKPIPIT